MFVFLSYHQLIMCILASVITKYRHMLSFQGYMYLHGLVYLFLIFIVGGMYYNMGFDGAKQLYNFGFCYINIIIFLYVPMLPILLRCKYFNRHYFVKDINLLSPLLSMASVSS